MFGNICYKLINNTGEHCALDYLCKYKTEENCFEKHCNGNCNVLGLYTHYFGNVRERDENKISLYNRIFKGFFKGSMIGW